MDNRGFHTLQPQQQQHSPSFEASQGGRTNYQSQTQYRVTTTSSSAQQQQQQRQFGGNVPDIRLTLENHQLELQTGGTYKSGTVASANRQQTLLQVPMAGGGRDFSDGVSAGGGGSAAVSLCATSQCDRQEHMSEDQYRIWLTENFKSRFEPYEIAGGMPLNEFKEMSQRVSFNRSRNLNQMFKKLDKDGNNRVSWNEFFNGLKYTKKTEVAKPRRALNAFVEGMTPAAKKKLKKEKRDAEESGEPIPEESYLEAYNCRPPPLFIPLFYVAVWIFFIIYAVELGKGPEWNWVGWDKGFPYYSPLVFCPSLRQQAWRFVSYMFLHDGYHHVVFNTILSLLLGIPLEMVHKAWRVAPVFLIGVIIGALASSIADPTTMLIGASGGVYSLFGAHYALIVMNWEELQDDWLNIRSNPLKFLTSGIMRLVYLTLLLVLDFGITFYGRYSGTQVLPVSVSAHVGGLLAGFFAGVPILRNIDKKPWEGILSIVCMAVLIAMFLFGLFWNIFYKGYPAADTIICSNTALGITYG